MVSLQQIFAQQAQVSAIRQLITDRVSESGQQELCDALEGSGAPRPYARQVLRVLLTVLESDAEVRVEPIEDVITTYAGLMIPISTEVDGAGPQAGSDLSGTSSAVHYRFLDHCLTIKENRNTLVQFGGTGYRTWEAALALGDHLIHHPDALSCRRKVLELGAGTGFAGMVAACLGGHATLTDGDPQVVERLGFIVAENKLDAQVEELYWSEDADLSRVAPNTLVIAADVLYDKDIFPAFLGVLSRLLSVPAVEALVATTVRNEDTFNTFLAEAAAAGLQVATVAVYDPASDPSEYFWFAPGPRIEICKVSKIN